MAIRRLISFCTPSAEYSALFLFQFAMFVARSRRSFTPRPALPTSYCLHHYASCEIGIYGTVGRLQPAPTSESVGVRRDAPDLSGSIPHEAYIYEWIDNWVRIPDTETGRANGRTHGVVVNQAGQVIVFHQANPAVLIFDDDGQLQSTWGERFGGTHGMTLVAGQYTPRPEKKGRGFLSNAR